MANCITNPDFTELIEIIDAGSWLDFTPPSQDDRGEVTEITFDGNVYLQKSNNDIINLDSGTNYLAAYSLGTLRGVAPANEYTIAINYNLLGGQGGNPVYFYVYDSQYELIYQVSRMTTSGDSSDSPGGEYFGSCNPMTFPAAGGPYFGASAPFKFYVKSGCMDGITGDGTPVADNYDNQATLDYGSNNNYEQDDGLGSGVCLYTGCRDFLSTQDCQYREYCQY